MGQTAPVRLSAIERAIGKLSPAWALRRLADHQALARAYEAGSPADPWKPKRRGASPQADYLADAPMVRAKARSLYQNVPYITAGIDGLVDHYIGTGITCVPTGPAAEADKKLWAAWCQRCDADGQTFAGLQTTIATALEVDGEVLVRRRTRRPEDKLPVPLQVQALEIDWLDTSRQQGAEGNNVIVNGKEFDALGRVVAYWLWDQHPGDVTLRRGTRLQSKRVTADQIIHLYRTKRPGESGGISRLANVIARSRDLAVFEDADLARKNLEARIGVLASGDINQLGNQTSASAALNPEATGSLGELPSGAVMRVPNGMNLTTVAPNPSTDYVPTVTQRLKLIAAGMGVPYELCTGDMGEVNFSSGRMRWLPFRRMCERIQWTLFIPQCLEVIRRWYVEAAVLSGGLPKGQAHPCEWATPRWEYVNPQQDVAAELDLVAGGMQSISEGIRRRGYEPELVFSEMERDVDRLSTSGVLDVLLAMRGKRATTEDSAAAAGNATP